MEQRSSPGKRGAPRERPWKFVVGLSFLALVIAGAVKISLDFRHRHEMHEANALIKSMLPGGEWICRRDGSDNKNATFTLSVNPGVQAVSPSGPINTSTPLDSTTHSPASSPQLYFGSSDLRDNKVNLKWQAHWTDPKELRALAVSTQRLLSADPARYATDLAQQNYVSNLYRGITIFDKPIMDETITVGAISRTKLSGTIVSATQGGKSSDPQPVECIRDSGAATVTAAAGPEDAVRGQERAVAPQHNTRSRPVAEPPRAEPPHPQLALMHDARSFIDEWFKASSSAQGPEDVLRFYAPAVKYYDRGMVSKSYIRQDKQYYFNRWPVRQSRIASPVNVTDTGDDKIVSFRLWYRLENGKQEPKEGTVPVRLVLGERDGRLLIVGESNG